MIELLPSALNYYGSFDFLRELHDHQCYWASSNKHLLFVEYNICALLLFMYIRSMQYGTSSTFIIWILDIWILHKDLFVFFYIGVFLCAFFFFIHRVTTKLRYYPKDYIREFMAESVSYLLRKAPVPQLKRGIHSL